MQIRIIDGLEVEGTEKEWAAFDKARAEREKLSKYQLSKDSFSIEPKDTYFEQIRASG